MIECLDNRIVSKRVFLKPIKNYRTGNTKETINGIIQTYIPYKLEIMTYPDMDGGGFYLVSMNVENEDINDTWHPNLQDAIEQATYEFNVDPSDWEDLAH